MRVYFILFSFFFSVNFFLVGDDELTRLRDWCVIKKNVTSKKTKRKKKKNKKYYFDDGRQKIFLEKISAMGAISYDFQ